MYSYTKCDPRSKNQRCQPENDDSRRDDPSAGHPFLQTFAGFLPATLHDRPGDQLDCEEDPQRHQKKIVYISKNGYEIGNEIDWAECVGYDNRSHDLRRKRSLRVPASQPERNGFLFQRSRLFPGPSQKGSTILRHAIDTIVISRWGFR